jgi:beta-aspartyl-peptidase (threonine type)
MMIVTHGGTESEVHERDGCEAAARAGLACMQAGEDALAAVVAAVSVLEDDGRYNAGRGGLLGMDGITISCDASVMDSAGRLGAVANLLEVQHPVQVARRVADTPHHLIVGVGALEFAKRLGLHRPFPPTEKAREKYRQQLASLQQAPDAPAAGAHDADSPEGEAAIKQFWNFPLAWQRAVDRGGASTVGAVACDQRGGFAVAVSTGGSMPALLGRVGDSPLIGCGFFAGPAGAVACTGVGEHILRRMVAARVYQWLDDGVPLRRALGRGMALLPDGVEIGLVGVSPDEAEVVSREPMASATIKRP